MYFKNNIRKIYIITFILLCVISLLIGVININELNFKIILYSRIPRLLSLILTGIGLSISGIILQKIFKNKFISPSTGTTISASTLGILISFIFMPNSNIFTRSLFSFVFSIITTFIFLIIVNNLKYKNSVIVPLIGIIIGNIISSFTNFLAYNYGMTQSLISWSTGHFSTVLKGNYEIIYMVFPLVIMSIIYINEFNIISMGEDISINLGIKYNKTVLIGIIITSLITSSIIVTVGKVPYIGLIIPNIVSIYKGDNMKNTIFDISILGAIFIIFCDIISRLIVFPYEMPINLIIGIIGSIIFIILIVRKGGIKN